MTRLLSTKPSSPESEQVSELRTQLVESRSQLDVVKEQLELVRNQAEQCRSISDSMEEELRKSSEASQLFRQQSQQQLLQMTNERDSLKSNLELAEEKLKVFTIPFFCWLFGFVNLWVSFRNWRKALHVWTKPAPTNLKKC